MIERLSYVCNFVNSATVDTPPVYIISLELDVQLVNLAVTPHILYYLVRVLYYGALDIPLFPTSISCDPMVFCPEDTRTLIHLINPRLRMDHWRPSH